MHIEWDAVTWYSKIITALVFVANGMLWFYVGMQYQATMTMIQAIELQQTPVAHTTPHQTILRNSSSSAQNVNTSGWKTYRNSAYGMTFRYPGYAQVADASTTTYGDDHNGYDAEGPVLTIIHVSSDNLPGGEPIDIVIQKTSETLKQWNARIQNIPGAFTTSTPVRQSLTPSVPGFWTGFDNESRHTFLAMIQNGYLFRVFNAGYFIEAGGDSNYLVNSIQFFSPSHS